MICARCKVNDLLTGRPSRAVLKHPPPACSDISTGWRAPFQSRNKVPGDSLHACRDVADGGEVGAAPAPLPLHPASPACQTQIVIACKMGALLLWSYGFTVSLITALTVQSKYNKWLLSLLQ